MRLARAWLTAGLALALAGCSTVRLAYNHFDWIADWIVGDYVEWSDSQQGLFDARFDALWRWHRDTQLPAYARDLRELAAALDRPLSREQVEDYLGRANRHWRRTLDQALPPTTELLKSLSDAQVETLLARIEREQREAVRKERKRTPEEARRKMARDMQRQTRRWVGALSDAQAQRIAAWADQRNTAPAARWDAYSQAWLRAFGEALHARAAPDFVTRLKSLLTDPQLAGFEDLKTAAAADREQWISLMLDLDGSLDARQRRHLQSRLTGLAEDFEALAPKPGN